MVTERMTTDDCLWLSEYQGQKIKEGLYIDQIIPGGVSDKAGLKNGDILIAIDGKKFSGTLEAQNILNSFNTDQTATYTVLRENQILNFEVTVYKLFNILSLIFALLGFGFLIIGHLVGYSKPKELTSQLFFFLGCSAALGFTSVNVTGDLSTNSFTLVNRIIGLILFYPLLYIFL